jgi:hypothetical protein
MLVSFIVSYKATNDIKGKSGSGYIAILTLASPHSTIEGDNTDAE